jgi:hypothetical protein
VCGRTARTDRWGARGNQESVGHAARHRAPLAYPTTLRQQVPGRKTDVSDAAWLCQLTEAGLLKANFVAPKPVRRLRNLTRYRKTQIQEIGDIDRFPSPAKLCGYTGLCPRVHQSGTTDRRGPLSKHGPRYLRWALFEAAMNACKHPLYKEHYQATKRRLRRQRGPKVAQIQLARKHTEAIWHMLTRNQPFAATGATFV